MAHRPVREAGGFAARYRVAGHLGARADPEGGVVNAIASSIAEALEADDSYGSFAEINHGLGRSRGGWTTKIHLT